LSRLDPNWSESLAGGEGEVLETMQELGIAPADGASDGRNTTVGSLISK